MGKGSGGGGQTTSTVTNSNIPEYARPYVENMLGATQKQIFKGDDTFQPYKPFSGIYDELGNQISYDPNKAVAGFQPMQEQAQRGIAGMQLPGEYGRASQQAAYAGMGGMDVAGQANTQGFQNQVGGYMNPYMQQVLNPQLDELRRQYGITGQQQSSQATQAGAYGGSRDAIMAAENNRNLGMAQNQAIGQAYDKSFGAAQQQYNQNLQNQLAGYGMMGQSANQLAGIGNQMLTGQQGIYNMQNAAGAQQQALEQQKINQAITDYANAQQYPLMQLGTLSNMLRGLPMQASTTNQYAAAPNALTQGIGAAGAGASIYNAMRPYASGGIASVPRYDVGGSVESTLENMDIDALKRELKGSPSPSVKRMAQRILAEKQMSQAPRMAGGGIVAFAPGGIAGANEGSAGEEEARIGMQERLAQPPAGIMGTALAPAPTPAPPIGTTPADIIPNLQNAYKAQQDTANKSVADIMAERQALRESLGAGKDTAREAYRNEQMAERANLKDEAERQKNMRLAQFFASWGSTPGSTLVAGMTALQKSIPGMIEDTKEAKKAKRDADKIIYDLDNADRLEKLGRIDEATAIKERASDNAQKLQQSLVQYQTSVQSDKARAASAKEVAGIQNEGSKYAADARVREQSIAAETARLDRVARRATDDDNKRYGQYQAATSQERVALERIASEENGAQHKEDLKAILLGQQQSTPEKEGGAPRPLDPMMAAKVKEAQARVTARENEWKTRRETAQKNTELAYSRVRVAEPAAGDAAAPRTAPTTMTRADVEATAKASGKTVAEVEAAAKAKGIKIK